jgi:hypothetical protein
LPRPPAPPQDSIRVQPEKPEDADAAATQQRVAEAFHRTIVPNLKACWPSVAESSGIDLVFTYAARDGNWTFQAVELKASPLPAEISATAVKCMQTAAASSTFPLDSVEAKADPKEFVITWGFPVPLPPDTGELARMISTGGGTGCMKTCHDCVKPLGKPAVCMSACKGYSGCMEDGTGSGCQMKRPECVSGWSGHRAAGLSIAQSVPTDSSKPLSSVALESH